MWQEFIHKHLGVPYRLHVHTDKRAKKPRATVIFLHGIGDSGAAWTKLIAELPSDVRAISVDLLGFGASPSPAWLRYDADVQARSVMATLSEKRIHGPCIVVGHSMGSIIAVQLAKRYPNFVKSLVLCSPPLYSKEETRRVLPSQEKLLRKFYQYVVNNPNHILRAVPVALKLRMVSQAFNITRQNVATYMGVIETCILNQTSLSDIMTLKKPIEMIYGMFDPVVVKKNLHLAASRNPSVELKQVRAGHDLSAAYLPKILHFIDAIA